MNAIFQGDPDENMMMDETDEELSSEETSQTKLKVSKINISARRRIEEYMEKKLLASQTADYFSD